MWGKCCPPPLPLAHLRFAEMTVPLGMEGGLHGSPQLSDEAKEPYVFIPNVSDLHVIQRVVARRQPCAYEAMTSVRGRRRHDMGWTRGRHPASSRVEAPEDEGQGRRMTSHHLAGDG